MTPTTKAGADLLAAWDHDEVEDAADLIDAIEREAAQQERERIRLAVERLPRWDKRSAPGGYHWNRAAVLDLLNHPQSCSFWFASDNATDQRICDCGYARLAAEEAADDPISDARQPEDGPPPGRWPR